MVWVLTGLARVHGFTFGDSLEQSKINKWKEFGSRLTKVRVYVEYKPSLVLDVQEEAKQ